MTPQRLPAIDDAGNDCVSGSCGSGSVRCQPLRLADRDKAPMLQVAHRLLSTDCCDKAVSHVYQFSGLEMSANADVRAVDIEGEVGALSDMDPQ